MRYVNIGSKAMAPRLRSGLAADGSDITRSQTLEFVAAQSGYRDWNTRAAAKGPAAAPATVATRRTFPGGQARRFSVDVRGCAVDWEHRLGDGMALYQQVSREGWVLRMSEHHDDANPGSAVRIQTSEVRRLQREPLDSLCTHCGSAWTANRGATI